MEDSKGFILLARKVINSDIFTKPPLYLKVWIYILSRAYHTDSKGIKRGELITSIKEIQDACTYYIGYRKEVPTTKQIRSILDYLRNPRERTMKGTMIVTMKVTHGILIKVLNYDTYQTFETYEGNCEKSTKDLRTDNKGHNKKNTLNNSLESIKNKKDKKEYGELSNVLLTDEEYNTLKEKNLLSYIDDLSLYIPNKKGKPYVNHYATILQWSRKDEKQKVEQKKVEKELPSWWNNQEDIQLNAEYDEKELEEKLKILRGEKDET